MTYRLETAPGFEHLEPFMLALPELFPQQEGLLHDARNRLKVMQAEGVPLVVKSFQQLGLLRRLVYTFIRVPKAERSFRNARRLQTLEIRTPDPVGYIQFYRHGVLADSYFLACRFDFDYSIGKAIHYFEKLDRNEAGDDAEDGDRMREILVWCADFTADMHSKGVLHLDYSKGNLLVRDEGGEPELAVIDVNRMSFGVFSDGEGLRNLVRLMKTPSARDIFIRRYATSMQIDEEEALETVKKAVSHHERFRRWRHRLKDMLGLRRG